VLVSSIRRRRHDLAILKTLGFVPAQVRRAVAWQATTLAVVALAIGVPLGVVSGRLIWSHFADQVGVLAETVTPALAVAAVGLGTVVLALVIALVPGRVAARTRPARVLRTA
jgi:ABC-type lipoprotein release transport system permease subunit